MERRRKDYIRPNNLHFDGVTDDDGRLTINFPYKPCHFSSDYEVAVDSLCLDTSTFVNVLESDRNTNGVHFTFVETTSSTVTTSTYYLPESKIFKFGEFAEKVNKMQNHFKIEVDHFRNKNEVQIGKK